MIACELCGKEFPSKAEAIIHTCPADYPPNRARASTVRGESAKEVEAPMMGNIVSRETMEAWLRAAAMLASRLREGELTSEEHLALREHIDHALVLVVKEVSD